MKIKFTLLPVLFIVLISCISCKKDDDKTNSNQQLIDKMKAVTDSVIANSRVPGVVALVVDNKKGINWMYTSGKNDVVNGLPMDSTFTFRIGSNTKTMTCTVLLQLVDEGLISLDDTLSKYFPGYPQADKITVTMLLNMRSGIYNYTDDTDVFAQSMVTEPSRVWQPDELIDLGFSHDFYFEPGSDIHYSNTNTFLIAKLIEKLTDNTLENEIYNRIIQPLGLENTRFLTSGIELPGNHGRGYELDGEGNYTDVTEHYDVSWGWAAGSAYSTPRDLQKYVEALVNGEFLTPTLQQKRLTDNYSGRADLWLGKINYGMGMMRCGSFYGHGGDMPGFSSTMYHSIEKDCTVVLYFNTQDDYPSALLFLRYLDILYGTDY